MSLIGLGCKQLHSAAEWYIRVGLTKAATIPFWHPRETVESLTASEQIPILANA